MARKKKRDRRGKSGKRKWSWRTLVLAGVPMVLIPGILFSLRVGTERVVRMKNYFSNKVVFPDTGMVGKVIDGDTIKLRSGAVVRLLMIDAPGRGRDGYAEAGKLMNKLVSGRRVWLEYDRVQDDKYGRILAWVWVGCEDRPKFLPHNYMRLSRNSSREGLMENPSRCKRGKLVNEELLKKGLARLVKYENWGKLKYEKRLRN